MGGIPESWRLRPWPGAPPAVSAVAPRRSGVRRWSVTPVSQPPLTGEPGRRVGNGRTVVAGPPSTAGEGVAPHGSAGGRGQEADEREDRDEDEHGNKVHLPAFRRVLTGCHYLLSPNLRPINTEGDQGCGWRADVIPHPGARVPAPVARTRCRAGRRCTVSGRTACAQGRVVSPASPDGSVGPYRAFGSSVRPPSMGPERLGQGTRLASAAAVTSAAAVPDIPGRASSAAALDREHGDGTSVPVRCRRS